MTDSAPQSWRRAVRGNVLALGLVSFFTDFSSEAIYPLLPVFLAGVGGVEMVPFFIGLMDGLADAVASLLKLWSGLRSDRSLRRKPLTLGGYGLSSLARPLMAFASGGYAVVSLRFLDRTGKGLRTAPRDALLSESVPAEVRGTAFAFHRMMDHAGAVAGPLAAALLLYSLLGEVPLFHDPEAAPGAESMRALRILFACAALPGIAAMAVLAMRVREARPADPPTHRELERHRAALPRGFPRFLLASASFALGNSSDLFLVLWARDRHHLGMGGVLALWVGLHGVKVLASLPGGRLADRFGKRGSLVAGWLLYALVYALLPATDSLLSFSILLALYGLYYGLTEGAERALVADFVPRGRRGRGYGFYHATVGLAALPASLLFGLLWSTQGPALAFHIGAGLALVAAASLARPFPLRPRRG